MRLFKKSLAILLVVVMSIGIFAGCGTKGDTKKEADKKEVKKTPEKKADDTSKNKQQGSAKKVEIRTVTMFGGTDPAAGVYQDALKEFMSKNPNVVIKDESAKEDEAWKQRVNVDFSAGNEADITFYFAGVDQKAIVQNGKVVSLDTIRKDYPNYAKNIKQGPLNMVKAADGKVYCVPVTGFYEGLVCNKDLFDKYNVELPTDWGKLEKAIKVFKEKGVVPISVALGHVPHYLIEHFILAVGGVEEHKNNFKTEIPKSWAEGLSYFKKFNDMGAFPVDTLTAKESLTSQLFKDKKAAMQVDGSWFLGGLSDKTNTVFLPFPTAPNGKKDPTSMIAGFSSGYFISTRAYNDSNKQKAVVDLVKYLTSNEMIAKMAGANGGMPAAAVVAPADTPLGKSAAKVTGAAKAVDTPIDMKISKAAWKIILDGIPFLLDGSMKPEELLKKAFEENKGE